MRSAPAGDPSRDLTTRARIRDAAIAVVAAHGPTAATVRRIAAGAGVSPALVIHHYGSMDNLRAECDAHVAAEIRRLKSDAMAEGPGLDLVAAIRESHLGPLLEYLAAVLAEDSAGVAQLVDALVADAEAYTEQGVAAGMVRPTDDPRGRAVVLTVWALGALVLHKHLRRLLGVDPTDPNFGRVAESARYIGPVWEIYGGGLMTEPFAARAQQAVAELATQDATTRRARP